MELVAGLPAELPATLVVAQHTSPGSPAFLADMLARAGSLSASVAVDGEPIERGHIYVARPTITFLSARVISSSLTDHAKTVTARRWIRSFAAPRAGMAGA
jgi:chemotaxis response regulator CheB